ncbi:transcription factor GTE4-like isoform X1 [Typha latifolia]|uniref:transcription factor GTE4-like isoform X1 n=1 Tax=Typha latifolia TaxID=4733 RepID=UPI003C2FF868
MASGPLLGEKHGWGESKVYSRKSHTKAAAKRSSTASQRLPQIADEVNSCRSVVTISLASGSRQDLRDLRRHLTAELEKVRALSKKLEEFTSPASGYTQSQLSVTATTVSESAAAEKEKRTPKANQYYKNSEFLLAKDKLPKSKSNCGKKHEEEFTRAFNNCDLLLSKLMKHKHGWVFNSPVDAKALGLHDYFTIIKRPMDLGTVKAQLGRNHYKSPKEFAEDVRLTFHNAMTYNPKGQDVHVMANKLLQMFEEHWSAIEAEFEDLLNAIMERSDSTVHPVDPKAGRLPALKKPKAKDPQKRDMTFEEKRRLSNNLQNLPPEKLDNVVQIIKKRNFSLSQHDDEIEVDIDSVDVETLWELDRFVTNYKKSLSKHKRKAELAMLAKGAAEQNPRQMNPELNVGEASKIIGDKNYMASVSPDQVEKMQQDASRSSSPSGSSSDPGSSSTDSDSDSSSA